MQPGQGRPFALDVPVVSALCLGVLAVLWAPALPPTPWAFALLVVPAAIALAGRGRLGLRPGLVRVLGWLALFGLGAGVCTWQGHRAMAERLPIALDGVGVVVDARVVGLPQPGPTGSRLRIEVRRVVGANADEAARALEGRRLALRWYGGGRTLRPGEVWRWPVRLSVPRPPGGPGQADAARHALVFGTIGEASVHAGARPLRFASAGGIDAVRDHVARRIAETQGAEQGRFVAALAVGDTRGLGEADWSDLRRFGLTHLIAISGFHVGLVAGLGVVGVRLAWWLFPGLALAVRRPQASSIAAVAVALGYAALAGFSLPTVRTVLMIAVVAGLAIRRRRVPAFQSLLVAIALIAVVDAFALLTPGFWLSCGGVAWLLWCLPASTSAWDPLAFLKAQWVATLGLLPIAAAFFLQVPVAGPLANLVAIPWISLVVVPLSLFGTLLLPLSEQGASFAWQAAALAMSGLWGLLHAVPSSLAGDHWISQPSPWAVPLAVSGAALLLLPLRWHQRLMGLVLALPLFWPAGPRLSPGSVDVLVFDAPRGDAVLLRTSEANVLVDAGPPHSSLVDDLRALGIERIDLRIETRGNSGRAGGIAALDAAFPPREVWRAPSAGAAYVRGEIGFKGLIRAEAAPP